MKQRDVLETVEWGVKHFGSIVTNRQLPLRDVRREVAAGTVKSIGSVVMCDGDGFTIEPERYREGFVLTEAGVKALESLRATDDAEQSLEASNGK